jgi:hypothetical protein
MQHSTQRPFGSDRLGGSPAMPVHAVALATHWAKRVGTWSKVRSQPTTALPMITSMTSLARNTSQGVGLLHQPPKYPGTTFGRLVAAPTARGITQSALGIPLAMDGTLYLH